MSGALVTVLSGSSSASGGGGEEEPGLPTPSSQWDFNGNGTDAKGVANLTLTNITANADNILLGNLNSAYFQGPAGAYAQMSGDFSFIEFFNPNSTSTNDTMFNIGSGTADNNGNNALKVTRRSNDLSFTIWDTGITTTLITTGAHVFDTNKLYMMAACYKRVGSGTSEMNLYVVDVAAGSVVASASSTTAVLLRIDQATWRINSAANVGVTATTPRNSYRLAIYDGTRLTEAQVLAIAALGSE